MNDNQYFKSYKKIRKTWDRSPVEQVVPSKKEYNRQEAKQHVKEVIDEELEAYNFDVEYYNDILDPIAD